MITVTQSGKEELKSIIDQMKCTDCGHEHADDAPVSHGGCDCGCAECGPVECSIEDMTLRLVAMGNGDLGLILDVHRDGDQTVTDDDVDLLLVGPELVESVVGLVMDCVETPEGRRLTIDSVSG